MCLCLFIFFIYYNYSIILMVLKKQMIQFANKKNITQNDIW